MVARIYRPSRPATQSGKGRIDAWVLEFEPGEPRRIEPLMGWTSSGDTRTQVRMQFPTAEAAVAWCERRGIAHRVETPAEPVRKGLSYSDNFKPGRLVQWTH
jgi:hypothetical protein